MECDLPVPSLAHREIMLRRTLSSFGIRVKMATTNTRGFQEARGISRTLKLSCTELRITRSQSLATMPKMVKCQSTSGQGNSSSASKCTACGLLESPAGSVWGNDQLFLAFLSSPWLQNDKLMSEMVYKYRRGVAFLSEGALALMLEILVASSWPITTPHRIQKSH